MDTSSKSSSQTIPKEMKPKHILRSSSSSNMLASSSPLDVNEEYMKAIRTKSYTDIFAKVHHRHLIRSHSTPTASITQTRNHGFASPSSTVSPSSSLPSYSHLSDYIEPTDDVSLLQSVGNPNVHSLLHDYFLTGVEAFHLCSNLLISIHVVRRQHHVLRRLLATTSTTSAELTSFVELENPLTKLKLFQFRHVQGLYASLTTRLALSHRKLARRIKLIRFLKHASGVVLVVACAGVSVAVLVVATHGLVGAVAAVCPVVLWFRWFKGFGRFNRMIRLREQVDAAAKGAYIVSRSLETMGSMVGRLHDEIERGKDVVRMFLRNGGETFLLKEVVKEMDDNERWFLEQLGELEEHVFWCLKTINKTRRMLAQELGGGGGGAGDGTNGSRTLPSSPTPVPERVGIS